MQRRRFNASDPLELRLSNEAQFLREQAEKLPNGAIRDATIRKARQAETGSQISQWLQSPGLQAPK